MTAASAILRSVEGGNFAFWCPGCGHSHEVAVGTPFRNGARWSFNGDQQKPTFAPSIHYKSGHHVDGTAQADCWLCKRGSKACRVCHSFIIDGRIQFLGDCTHALAGQTVDLPEWRA
jgi:hypothetical protein